MCASREVGVGPEECGEREEGEHSPHSAASSAEREREREGDEESALNSTSIYALLTVASSYLSPLPRSLETSNQGQQESPEFP